MSGEPAYDTGSTKSMAACSFAFASTSVGASIVTGVTSSFTSNAGAASMGPVQLWDLAINLEEMLWALKRKELDLDLSEEKLVLAQESIGMCKK